ncbi:hypothetical protein FRB99_006364 [Tulasnella sp. 403]|nr:hypothetical protein FRB99_006364 [Tulasnella sp. 403]
MPPYVYELPSTGAISFTDICIDATGAYTTQLVDATTARANLRSLLKETRHSDGEKDYLRIIKTADDYLPHLYAIIACVNAGELSLRNNPVFSWRSTLSSRTFSSSPRLDVPSLYADLVFTLLTLAFTYSNLASATLLAIGQYELDRYITDDGRKAKDEKLNFAINLLARSSGVYEHITDKLLPEWERATGGAKERPPELKRDIVSALARLALADSSQLAIRKLMTRSAYDSTLTPGPPLPKTHPPTSLLAKLYVNASSLYTTASSLINTSSASSSSNDHSEIIPALRRYLSDERDFTTAMAYKWFGVDAGEAPGRCGHSITYLKLSKAQLEALKESKLKVPVGINSKANKEQKASKKDRLHDELETVKVFLKYYQKMNDSVHFLPIPSESEIKSSVPDGRSAVHPKPFQPPAPAFGPTSPEALRRQAEALDISDGEPAGGTADDPATGSPSSTARVTSTKYF